VGIVLLSNMLLKENAISIEKQDRISGGARKVYLFKCEEPNCSKIIVLYAVQGVIKLKLAKSL